MWMRIVMPSDDFRSGASRPTKGTVESVKATRFYGVIVAIGVVAVAVGSTLDSVQAVWRKVSEWTLGKTEKAVPKPVEVAKAVPPDPCSIAGMLGAWECHGKCDLSKPEYSKISKLFLDGSNSLRFQDGRKDEGNVTLDFRLRTITVIFK